MLHALIEFGNFIKSPNKNLAKVSRYTVFEYKIFSTGKNKIND